MTISNPRDMVGASGLLVLILGVGSVTGPLLVGPMLSIFGASGFFLLIAFVHIALSFFAIWRMSQRPPLEQEAQGPYVALHTAPSSVVIEAVEEVHSEQLAENAADANASPKE